MAFGRVLIRNLLSNGAGFAVQAGLAFVMTPFVLRELGEARYGVWALIVGLTGYYGLLDLGFRAGLCQYLTRYLASGDFERLNRTASTGFVALGGCGVLILLVSAFLGRLAPGWFNLSAACTASEVEAVILIVGGGTAVQFAFFPFSAVLVATQRFDLSNLIGVGTRLLTAAATFAVLLGGAGLIGISLAVAGGNLLDYLLRWRAARRVLPELHISPRLADRHACWEFMQFGLWSMLSLAGMRIIAYSDAVVIGLFLPVAAITPFVLGMSLATYFQDAFAPLGQVFFPAATRLDAEGNLAALRRLYLTGSRFLLMAAVVVGLIAGFWAEDFFRLWIGARAGADFASPALILQLLLVGGVIAAGQRVGYQVLLGTRRVRMLALLFAGEAAVNLALSLLLIGPLGLIGVALGHVIPAVVFQGVVQPVAVGCVLGTSYRHYVKAVCLRPLLVGAVLTPLLALVGLMGDAWATTDRWWQLATQGGIAVLAALGVVFVVGLDGQERERLLAAVRPAFMQEPKSRRRERKPEEAGELGCFGLASQGDPR